ncbi:hypothetical protein NKT34_13585 [Paenibacillus polysaccharolyticus]|uniref:hypothetical protein n=1 Tax=Paenibacillus polysaccharolyticus TaxID=582692 RepID=UPI00209EDEBC|nr:hypothetical protein [Paenibacillus polysaccharolyticus]MCP1134331.1 hypothetical protein [Paenibacillus polysaccharolyticus]
MTSPMTKVSSLVSSELGDTLSNIKNWGNLFLNAGEHGVYPTGDATSALQKLVNLANSQGRTTIVFPESTEYYVTSISNDEDIVYFGDGAVFIGGYDKVINKFADYLMITQQLSGLEYLKAANRNILTVAKTGGQFSKINDAIDYARNYCTINNRVTISVAAGKYNEEINLMPNPGIDIIGSGCDTTIITYASVYPNAPIYTVGTGYFQDIGFVSETSGDNSYAFHFESQNNNATGFVKFVNCSFLSNNNSGVGIGLGQDTGVQFVGCDISAVGYPSLYAHNYPANNISNQLLEIRNTKLSCYSSSICAKIDDAAKLYSFSNSVMGIIVANCESNVPKIEYRNGGTTLTYIPKSGTDIILNVESVNTNILGLNYNESEITTGGICFVAGNGLFTIPVPNASLRDYTVLSAIRADDSNNILGTVTLAGTGESYVAYSTSDTTVRQHAININIKATAK